MGPHNMLLNESVLISDLARTLMTKSLDKLSELLHNMFCSTATKSQATLYFGRLQQVGKSGSLQAAAKKVSKDCPLQTNYVDQLCILSVVVL